MPSPDSRASLNCLSALSVGESSYVYYSLKNAEAILGDLTHLPCSMRILLENLLRNEEVLGIPQEDMRSLCAFHALRRNPPPLRFLPARLAMEERGAISTLNDLAAMRAALAREGQAVEPLAPACPLDVFTNDSSSVEQAALLKWGTTLFPTVRALPAVRETAPRLVTGRLGQILCARKKGEENLETLFPDTLLGTSRFVKRSGALGILGWQADILDLESVLLGREVVLDLPTVLGVKLTGKKTKGGNATDIALGLLSLLRSPSPQGTIIEFYGPGLDHLSVEDRILIIDYLDELNPLSVLFPIDTQLIDHLTRRHAQDPSSPSPALVEAYAKAQGLWRESWPHDEQHEPSFSTKCAFSLEDVRPSLGGPGQAFNPLALGEVGAAFKTGFPQPTASSPSPLAAARHGDIVFACIGPMGGGDHPLGLALAGLVARKARAHGLALKPWVRGALVLPDPALRVFLEKTGLAEDLVAVGFQIYRDAAEIPPLTEAVVAAAEKERAVLCALACAPAQGAPLHPACKAGYVGAPSHVALFALMGSITAEVPKNILPTAKEIEEWTTAQAASFPLPLPAERPEEEKAEPLFLWPEASPYLVRPSFLDDFTRGLPPVANVKEADVLALLGNDVSADAFAPHGPIGAETPAGRYLIEKGLPPGNLGCFEDFIGNEDVMARGAGAMPFLTSAGEENQSAPASLFEQAEKARAQGRTLILAAGQNFGHGARREWAVKTLGLLGLYAVLAESFAPAFRVNLVQAGVLPLQLKSGVALSDLKLESALSLSFVGLPEIVRPPAEIMATINHRDNVERYMIRVRLDSEEEIETWRQGSIWAETVRNLILLSGS